MSDNLDLINEYKDQVRILKQEVAELQDAGKSKDSANKRCLQKLEHSQQDLDQANKKIKEAGPSVPVSVLGLDGAPQAGDKFNVFEDEKEAKQIAAKRTQLVREQSVRTQKQLTLDEIGRRIALGDFKELNIILKGDVDGSRISHIQSLV